MVPYRPSEEFERVDDAVFNELVAAYGTVQPIDIDACTVTPLEAAIEVLA